MTANIFDLNRTLLLLKRMVFLNRKTVLIGCFAFWGMILVMQIPYFFVHTYSYQSTMTSSITFMYIFGFIFTSNIFKEAHKPLRSFSYLTLPASSFEKYIVSWLFTSVFYVIVFSVLIFLAIFFCETIAYFSTGQEYNFPGISEFFKVGLTYVLFQAFFFFGAIYFKNSNFIKTAASLIAVGLVLFFASMLIIKLFFINDSIQSTAYININYFNVSFIGKEYFDIVFKYLLPLTFLVTTYFSLKEKEV
jgi:hypothetical protein